MKHLTQEENAHGFLLAVDPRIRLIAGGLLLALVVSSNCGTFPWLVAGICLTTAFFSGMTLRVLCLRLLHPLFITAMILALKTFMGTGHSQLFFTLGRISVFTHPEGFRDGLLIASRIMGAASVAILLSQIMTFTETMAALAWLRVPRGFVDVSLFAWRSLFMLYDGAGVVYTAQKNRLGYCGLRRSLRSFGSMAGMLTIRAMDGSQSMTTAMIQRGYDGSLPLLRHSRLSISQFVGLLVFVLAATATWKLQN